MVCGFFKMDPTSLSRAWLGQQYIFNDAEEAELRQLILLYAGLMPPKGVSVDKLVDMAYMAYSSRMMRARNTRPPEEWILNYHRIMRHWTNATCSVRSRKSAKASEAFKKMNDKGPSPTSAMGMAWAELDANGDMSTDDLMVLMVKKHKKHMDKRVASSYRSTWRRKVREEGGVDGQAEPVVQEAGVVDEANGPDPGAEDGLAQGAGPAEGGPADEGEGEGLRPLLDVPHSGAGEPELREGEEDDGAGDKDVG